MDKLSWGGGPATCVQTAPELLFQHTHFANFVKFETIYAIGSKMFVLKIAAIHPTP